jgi:2-isopropylmalate synthase
VRALREAYGYDVHVLNYHEHGIGAGEDAAAVSYVQLRVGADRALYGVGTNSNIVTATLLAVVSAVNRANRARMACVTDRRRGWLTLQ